MDLRQLSMEQDIVYVNIIGWSSLVTQYNKNRI